jgi:hypothetical protein
LKRQLGSFVKCHFAGGSICPYCNAYKKYKASCSHQAAKNIDVHWGAHDLSLLFQRQTKALQIRDERIQLCFALHLGWRSRYLRIGVGPPT